MRSICLAILITASFASAGVNVGDDRAAKLVGDRKDCESKLVGDRYWAVVRECLRMGILGDEELAKIAASERPLNPYMHLTPTTKTATPFRIFVNLLGDSQVQKNWDTTRAYIQEVVNERLKLVEKRNEANLDTKAFLNPREIKSFPVTHQIAAGVLENGVPVLAYVEGWHTLKILRLTDGKKIYSGRLPVVHSFRPGDKWTLLWHQESNGKVRLYLSTNKFNAERASQSILLFKFDLDHPEVEQLPYEIFNALNLSLHSAGPGMLYLSVRTDARYIISTDEDMNLPPFSLSNSKEATVRIYADHIQLESQISFSSGAPPIVKDGKVLPSITIPGSYQLLRHNGQVMYAFGHDRKLEVRMDADPNYKFSIDYPPAASVFNSTTLYETRDGRVLMAAFFYDDVNSLAWRFYEVGAEQKSIETHPEHQDWKHFWIQDPIGEPLFLSQVIEAKNKITVKDPFTGKEVYRSDFTGALLGALQVGKQVYIWTEGEKIKIYSLFNSPDAEKIP